MSGWIWMQGVDVAIADPIAPVVPEDKRESVKELIANHREKIDKVKESLEDDPLYDPANKHDDLWVLRFILSHKKKTKPALKAAKHTLQFREKHNLDDEDIRGKDPHKLKSGNVHEYWQKRCKGDAILTTHPDPKRGVIMFLLLGHMDPNAVNMLTEEVWNDAFIYSSEYTHQWLDYTTRTTGRMTRSVRIIDMRGSSISHFDRKSSQRDGKIMGEMEDCYPQLLETIFAVYAPTFMHWAWSVIRPIMPRRVIDKVDIVEPYKNDKERQRFLKHITLENIPVDYGGTNTKPVIEW